MSSYLDKLNLRPQERRLFVGVLIVVFIVLNIWLVWPHFGDWKQVKGDLENSQKNLDLYRKKITQADGPKGFMAHLKMLEGEGAQNIVADEQEIQLERTVKTQIQQSKVLVSQYFPITRANSGQTTNEFFEEQSIKISVNTGEKELIDFLLNIGAGGSMIRVRDLDLKPADQNRYRLQGSITLSANYQKKQAAKPAVAAAKPATVNKPATVTKPATTAKPVAPAVKPPPPSPKKS